MGEQKCVVSYCCCGCSLKSGSLAIAITVLIFTLIGVIYNIYAAVKSSNNGGWIGLVIYLVISIMSIFLIQGIRQERRRYVMAWVWTMAVFIVVNLIFIIIMMITTVFLAPGLIALLFMTLSIYMVVVVRSYGLTLGSSPSVA